MRLVLRRARTAKSLLAAAAGVTLIATVLVTGLAAYSREVVAAGARGAVASATAEERSVLVRGSAGDTPAELSRRDSAVRSRFAGGLGGRAVTVSGAGYSSGRQFSGPTGDAVPDSGGLVFASVMFLDGLSGHAVLSSGAWPRPGATTVQAALAEPVATVLGVRAGNRVPITDRVDGSVTTVVVAGVWRPRDLTDPYWRLVPEVATGVAPQSATYGPVVVDRADFGARFARSASAAWLAEPDLAGAGLADVTRVAGAAAATGAGLAAATGLGTSGLVTTRLGQLSERIGRADLVGRSAIVTPVLLVVILSGLALMLVAALLIEHRRDESALLRARGAARLQLAGLSARESLLVVVPAAAVAPPLAAWALAAAGDAGSFAVGRPATAGPDLLLWLVAAVAAAGCAAAITVPALRGGGTYVAELAGRSRPTLRSAAQRIGVDVLLVALAVLSWLQLRQYASPVAQSPAPAAQSPGGGLGIDPMLVAAPTVGVVAGALLALRLLPPAARLAERWLGRRSWPATQLGVWQAGRRPHAGPVLLLALAVAAGTVAWCLAGTSARSVGDQADHEVGADLRAVETGGVAPPGRGDTLAALPGAGPALPAWRETLRAGPDAAPAQLIALDAARAGDVAQVRRDLFAGGAPALFSALSRDRIRPPVVELPAGARRLTGRIEFDGAGSLAQTSAVFTDPAGTDRLVPLPTGPFTVALPASAAPLRLAGFLVSGDGAYRGTIGWRLTGLAADGRTVPLGGPWGIAGRPRAETEPGVRGATLGTRVYTDSLGPTQFAVVRPMSLTVMPVVATPEALQRLRLSAGRQTALRVSNVDVLVKVVGTMPAVPGTTEPAALLADLPSLGALLLHQQGVVRSPQEWWMSAGPETHTAVASAARALGGLQVLDRRAIAESSGGDPFGVGARTALFVAALGALLLAAVGIAVDVRTTARRRLTELAVLHTLGAGTRLLARSIMVEQAFLAGIGVLVGLAVGIGVSTAMAPLLILTPAARHPVPPPLLEIDWLRVGGTAALLLALALGLSALVGAGLRRRLTAAQLRIGADR